MPSPDWRGLFDLGVAFRAISPWKWMRDTNVFGVRDPSSDRIGWCVVLGSGGELEGLSVYLGGSGFDTYRSIQRREGFAPDGFWGQDALVFLFGNRDEVSAEQRAAYKELGFKFRGRGAWPAFTEHRIGYLPRDLPASEVAMLAECLRQTLVVAERLRADPEYLEPDDEDRLLVVSGNDDERVPEPAPPPEPPVPQPDQVALGRVRARSRRSDVVVELGVFPLLGTALDGPAGLYVPAAAMAVDARSGMILAQNIGTPVERDLLAQQLLVAAIQDAEAIPGTVSVSNHRTAAVLAPITEGLDIGLEVAEQLPMLDEARESMMGFFAGGF